MQSAFAQGVFGDDAALLRLLASPPERFGVYRASVKANLRGALREIYPVVLRLTGEKFFEQAASIFVRDQASASGDLHRYGKQFADFLAAYAPAQTLAYLPDAARLEWLWHESFHSADPQPAKLERLADIAPEDYGRLRFQVQAGCRRMHSNFPVHRIWETNQPGYAGDAKISLDEGGAWLVVYRFGLEVRIAPLRQAEDALLAALDAGQPFERAATQALSVDPDLDVGAALARFVSEQIITGFSLDQNEEEEAK
ncbi:MAG: HvfC/BufC family peptide modification chaperone [Burkholderiales bacterium]